HNQGATYSGRVTGVAPDPTNANVIYISTAGGGVWKTLNGGISWSPLTDSQSTLSMGAIAVSPSNPNVVYAGTGETHFSGDSFYGTGILKSINGGATWTLLQGNPGLNEFYRKTISRIAVDPATPSIVYAAVDDFGVNGLS